MGSDSLGHGSRLGAVGFGHHQKHASARGGHCTDVPVQFTLSCELLECGNREERACGHTDGDLPVSQEWQSVPENGQPA